MADDPQENYAIFLEPVFNRFLEAKLERTYDVLAPSSARRINQSFGVRKEVDENSCDLRPSLLRQAKRRNDHCQPSRSPNGVCRQRGL